MLDDYKIWLKRAESALAIGKIEFQEDFLYEDLCFQLQQAVEKGLKALFVYNNIEPPKTHSFRILLNQLNNFTTYPPQLKKVIELEDYAVQTRYPGDYTPVSKNEYLEAIDIAENTLIWVKSKIK